MSDALIDQSRTLFIRRWGEMGASWGVSRTMAEIHALLFVSDQPLCTDDLMDRLLVSRGNVSMNLRQLLTWGLIQRIHRAGDRKEYFVAESDVWQMFAIITRERRRREVEPIIETIDRCREMLEVEWKAAGAGRREEIGEFRRRLDDMQEFFNVVNSLFNLMVKVGRSRAGEVMKALSRFNR